MGTVKIVGKPIIFSDVATGLMLAVLFTRGLAKLDKAKVGAEAVEALHMTAQPLQNPCSLYYKL